MRPISTLILLILLISTTSTGYTNLDKYVATYTPRIAPPDVKLLKVIQVNEVLDRIRMGQPIEYDHVLIKGNLSLSLLGLPTGKRKNVYKTVSIYDSPSYKENATLFLSLININDSIIEGNVDLRNTIFTKSVNFKNTRFNNTADFAWSQFNGTADFTRSQFNENASFNGCQFNSDAHFEYIIFTRLAIFWDTKFDSSAYFSKSQFNSPAFFSGSQFCGDTRFRYSQFKEDIEIGDSQFDGITDFIGAQFKSDAYLGESQFSGDAYFRDSQFNGDSNWVGSQFIKAADFTSTEFNGNTHFGGSKFYGYLDLTKTKFNSIDIYWPHVNRLICNDGPTYLMLIKNYRDLEQFDIADDIYYQYRHWRQDQKPWSDISKYIDILGLYTCGYGVRVNHTISLGICVSIIFSLIYFLINSNKKLHKACSLKNLNESFWFSLIVLLSAPKELYPLGDETYEDYAKHIKYLPVLERIIGWSLLILLINTLSRVMIRY